MHVVCSMDRQTNRTQNKSNSQNEKVEAGRQLLINQEEEKETCLCPFAALLKNLLKLLYRPCLTFTKNASFFATLQCFKVFDTVDYLSMVAKG